MVSKKTRGFKNMTTEIDKLMGSDRPREKKLDMETSIDMEKQKRIFEGV